MAGPGTLSTLFDDAARPPVDAAELAFYTARLPLAGLVLDAQCGSGRLLVPLLRTGRAMHGADPSAAMLQACQSRLTAAALSATLVRQDLDTLNLPFRYTAAYVAGAAFQRLTDPVAARIALERLRTHLVPPGVLLLEMFVPSESAQRLGAALVEVSTAQLPDGSRIALRAETTTFAEERIARSQRRYVHRRGAERLAEETELHAMTWYPPEDIVALVADAGFSDVAVDVAVRPAADGQAWSVSARL